MSSAQQQAWQDAIAQKSAQYQAQTNQALDLATLHQALSYPRSWGPTGSLPNPLLSPANNTATPLFQATNPFNFQLMNYMMSAPGGQTIGLPGDSGVDSSNVLLAQLLGRSGAG